MIVRIHQTTFETQKFRKEELLWTCVTDLIYGDHEPSPSEVTNVGRPVKLCAGYLSQSMRLGVLTVAQHQVFSLEQLEEATDNFSRGALIGEGIRGKVLKAHTRSRASLRSQYDCKVCDIIPRIIFTL